MQKILFCLFALFAIGFAFAFREDAAAGEDKPRFARDAGDPKRPFAFAFAKRSAGEDEGYLMPRFARDLDEKSKFAFAFAKRAEEGRRFARDLTGSDESSRFAFAKRGDDEMARFAKFA